MNPFRKSPSALRPMDRNDLKRWICPEQAWKQLQHYVENNENLAILGVEGSGKSTLLNMFFSTAYCEEAAQANKLIFTANLSDTEDGDDLCSYLIDNLLEAAQDLLPESVNQKLERTMAKAHDKSPKQTFVDLCDRLYKSGYTILLVQDGFEHFVSSPNITQDQHDMLRSLLDRDVMRCIVATNYDLERTSLPKDVQGSMYLQKFQQKLTLTGFSREEAAAYLQNILKDNEIQFNEKQLGVLLNYTSGIPGLLETSAAHMYDMILELGGVNPKRLGELLRDAVRPTLPRWCKYFTPEYEQVLASIHPNLVENAYVAFTVPSDNTQDRTAAARLCDRGLWVKTGPDSLQFNCLLLQNYFFHGEYVSCTQGELVPADIGASLASQLSGMGGAGIHWDLQGATINITNNNQQTTNNQTTNVHNQILNLTTTKELLGMLISADAGREGLAATLHQRLMNKLPAGGLAEIERTAEMSDAEYDVLCDDAFARHYSNQMVDTINANEEDVLTDITEEEQLTLDQRFREARQITRPELTDAILEKVSARTGFYLKLSVVVEDALSVLKLIKSPDQEVMDCSPQLILYGKAVEQQLKDSFFPLFHREPTLQNYRTKTVTHGRIPFATVKEEDTAIGNYMHAIKDNISTLSAFCSQHSLHLDGATLSPTQWDDFWTRLHRNINKARDLRNLSAHTSRTRFPRWEDVDRIVALSFGSPDGNSIFACCAVCSDLNISLFGHDTLDMSARKALEGTEKTIHSAHKTKNYGVHGRLEEPNCIVKISPARIKQFRSAYPNVDVETQEKYRVRLIEYKEQDGELFFSAEALAPV